jgi:ABC-type transporter Mla subunit MlaD
MQTKPPTPAKILTMALFALSTVGLLLYLWLSFGGEVPFNPRGYRFAVAFSNDPELAVNADVRIAGVTVGKVISKALDPAGNRTLVTIQLDNRYAPIPKSTRAILRIKTIAFETYVQLIPGPPRGPPLPDNALLPRGQVLPTVQLDTIFNALDPNTRRAFQVWTQQLAAGVRGNGTDLNNALGNLPAFAADANDILNVLDVEHGAVVNLLRGGGTVFAALTQNESALRNLVTSSDAVLRTTARNQAQLAAVVQVLPTFLDQTRLTMDRLRTFSQAADPLARELIPVARNLGPTLRAVRTLSPNLKHLFVNLRPLIAVSKQGLPAVAEVLRGLGCSPQPGVACSQSTLLPALATALEQLNPILNWLSIHQLLMSDFIANGGTGLSATTTALGGSGLTCHGLPCAHYLRQFGVSGNEGFGIYQNRDPNNRGNTYPPAVFPIKEIAAKEGLPAWDCKNAGGEHGPEGDQPFGSPTCWVAPPLSGAKPYRIPHLLQAHYPNN